MPAARQEKKVCPPDLNNVRRFHLKFLSVKNAASLVELIVG